MRKLKSSFGDTTINVVRHVILKNFWEYYVTDRDCGNVDLSSISTSAKRINAKVLAIAKAEGEKK